MTKEEIQIYTRRITNGNRTDLVVTTYDIILTYFHDAHAALGAGEEKQFIWNLKKASDFLNELIHALDCQYQLGKDLLLLYRYIQDIITQCIMKKIEEGLDSAENIIIKLKTSFEEVAKQDHSGPVIQHGGQVYAGITYGRGTLNELYDNSSRGFKA